MTPTDDAIRATLLDLAHRRGLGRSFCPSEAARALSDDWRPLMPRIRELAATLPALQSTQKGRAVDPATARGPIRLSLRPAASSL